MRQRPEHQVVTALPAGDSVQPRVTGYLLLDQK